MSMETTFGQRVLLARRDLNMNQEDVADRAGVSRPYVSNVERGYITNPTVDAVQAIAHALGVRPDYLLGWSDDPTDESLPASIAEGRLVYQIDNPEDYRRVQELLDIIIELNADDVRILLDLAQRLRRAGNVRIIGNNP